MSRKRRKDTGSKRTKSLVHIKEDTMSSDTNLTKSDSTSSSAPATKRAQESDFETFAKLLVKTIETAKEEEKENEREKSNFLEITKLVVGSVGAITALFSLAGFLLLKSFSEFLGVSDFMNYGVSDYLYEGGIFFFKTLMGFSIEYGFLGALFFAALSVPFIIYLFITDQRKKNKPEYTTLMMRTRESDKWRKFISEAVMLSWRLISILVGVGVLVWILSLVTGDFLLEKDLLFGNYLEVRHLNDAETLRSAYLASVLYFAIAIVVFWLLQRLKKFSKKVSGELSTDKLQRAEWPYTLGQGVVLLFCITIFFILPIKYGRTMKSLEFPRIIKLNLKSDVAGIMKPLLSQIEGKKCKVWMIRESNSSYVLFLEKEKRVQLLPKGRVVALQMGRKSNLFSPNPNCSRFPVKTSQAPRSIQRNAPPVKRRVLSSPTRRKAATLPLRRKAAAVPPQRPLPTSTPSNLKKSTTKTKTIFAPPKGIKSEKRK